MPEPTHKLRRPLARLNFDEARRAMCTDWEALLKERPVSRTDCFTDGFWGAREWAFERIQDLLPKDLRAEIELRLGLQKKIDNSSGIA